MSQCKHVHVVTEVFDQTLGVACNDCGDSWCCWADEHCSEALWNRAVANEKSSDTAKVCELSREDVCFLCETKLEASK